MAEARSVTGNYDAAKMPSLELDKQNLVGQIQTEVATWIEYTIANEQMNRGDAESIIRSVLRNELQL